MWESVFKFQKLNVKYKNTYKMWYIQARYAKLYIKWFAGSSGLPQKPVKIT